MDSGSSKRNGKGKINRKSENVAHLFQDGKNLWCCVGRIGNVDVPYQEKHPHFLDKNHYFTKLIIAYHHKLAKHNGVRETLNSIRAGYWIPQGRSIVCKFIFNCSICKKNEGKPCSYPQHINLAKERLSEGHAFLNIGIDYAGPLYAKDVYNNYLNNYRNYYVCIEPWNLLGSCS